MRGRTRGRRVPVRTVARELRIDLSMLDSGFIPMSSQEQQPRRQNMPVVRVGRNPELSTIHSEMNRLFSTFFDTPTTRGVGNGAMRRWIPAMDLVEAGEHFVVKADLPGMTQDDVTIE